MELLNEGSVECFLSSALPKPFFFLLLDVFYVHFIFILIFMYKYLLTWVPSDILRSGKSGSHCAALVCFLTLLKIFDSFRNILSTYHLLFCSYTLQKKKKATSIKVKNVGQSRCNVDQFSMQWRISVRRKCSLVV